MMMSFGVSRARVSGNSRPGRNCDGIIPAANAAR
jgi:hypothetical protein